MEAAAADRAIRRLCPMEVREAQGLGLRAPMGPQGRRRPPTAVLEAEAEVREAMAGRPVVRVLAVRPARADNSL